MEVSGMVRRFSSGKTWNGKRFRRCVVHIGAEKTGSSAIQHFLVQNRDTFAAEGILYPKSSGLNGGTQWEFAAAAHPQSWTTDIGLFLNARTEDKMNGVLARFQDEFEAEISQLEDPDTLLISSEHLQSRLTTIEHLQNLQAFLSPYAEKIEIIVYFRRQDRTALSLYSTKIKSGNTQPQVFPPLPEDRLPYYFDFDHIHKNWVSVFGSEAVHVGLYDKNEFFNNDLIDDYCRFAGLNLSGKTWVDERVNTSLSTKGAQFLIAVNRLMPNIVDGKRDKQRDLLAQDVARSSPGSYVPVVRAEAKAFQGRFEASNDALKKRAFPERQKPIFDDDFSEYPESVEVVEPTYDEAVEMAIGLWKVAEQRNADLVEKIHLLRVEHADELSKQRYEAIPFAQFASRIRRSRIFRRFF